VPDWDPSDGSALQRFAISLLFFGALAIVGFVALSWLGVRFPMRAEAASEFDSPWGFAQPAADAMTTAAIQVCGAEALARAAEGTQNEEVRKAQIDVLTGEYNVAAEAYNRKVKAIVASGNRRPWEVPAVALPLSAAKSRFCLKVATVPKLAPEIQQATNVIASVSGRFLTLEQLDAYAVLAGWPMQPGWWPEMRRVILCETRSLDTQAHNSTDPNGGSYGLAQLNGSQHFEKSGEDFTFRYDPVVNLRTALWLRTVRGHFGGAGGWATCAAGLGID
jgi:hypothetical protein